MLLPSYQKSKKKIYVVGLGVTGLSAVKTLQASGVEVVAFDDDENHRRSAIENNIAILFPNDWQASHKVDILLLSPGIAAVDSAHLKAHPAALRGKELGVRLMVDADILFDEWQDSRDFIFITGTNGKSTTTKLVAHILTENKKSAVMGGNIGKAALSLPAVPLGGIYVLELSSYQLERMLCPIPNVAVLLNLSFDHLERHETMENYLRIKTKIFSGNGKQPDISI
ncbi:MAG: Mur ligase family protein, partial [Alphaproteobacteria bacterium]